jgi:hypothetical protein
MLTITTAIIFANLADETLILTIGIIPSFPSSFDYNWDLKGYYFIQKGIRCCAG